MLLTICVVNHFCTISTHSARMFVAFCTVAVVEWLVCYVVDLGTNDQVLRKAEGAIKTATSALSEDRAFKLPPSHRSWRGRVLLQF